MLYLGTSHATTTSLRLAEYRTDIDLDTVTNASAVLVDGKREWVQWKDIDFDDEDFSDCSIAFEREHPERLRRGV